MLQNELEKAIKKALNDGETSFKVLWRMSQGNLDKAREIVRSLVPHYTTNEFVLNAPDKDFNEAFDIILGEINGGIEVEWLS